MAVTRRFTRNEGDILNTVDPLVLHDIQVSQETAPADKLAQALELMDTGLRLKRAALRAAHPGASDREIDAIFERWLLDDE